MSTKLVLFGVFFSLSSKFRPGLRPGLGQVYYQNSAPFWGKRVHIGNCDPFVRQELSQPRTDCLCIKIEQPVLTHMCYKKHDINVMFPNMDH